MKLKRQPVDLKLCLQFLNFWCYIHSSMEGASPQVERPDNQRFYDAFTASPIGIALENLEGQPLFANPALCSMLGFSEEEMCSKHCVEFSPSEDAEKDWALFEQLRQGLIDHYHLEKRFFRKDGSLIWGRLNISLMRDPAGLTPLVVVTLEDISGKRAAEERLQQSEANLQKLAGRLIQAQEEERAWIARELHDDISQRLALLAVNLGRLKQELPASAVEFSQGVAEASKEAEDLGSDVQALSHRLHPSKLELMGLARAAASFCGEFSDRQKVAIDFHSENVPKDLSKDLSLCLFRVMQEALRNASKHSGSQHLQVSLVVESDEIHLTVQDAGVGFDAAEALKGPGLGLTSMKERLKLVNGDFSVESQLQPGTTIHARVPLTPRTKAAGAA
jgi:PAS domain S-box-containing protein